MYDIYLANDKSRCRFLLGKQGKNMLLVIGLNPSTADQQRSDTTATKVETIARHQGYDGFVMANLYPQRSTDPKALPKRQAKEKSQQNIQVIQDAIKRWPIGAIWAAWGQNIQLRPYLLQNCAGIARALQNESLHWSHYGSLSKQGHPRHPSRAAYGLAMNNFDIESYSRRNG